MISFRSPTSAGKILPPIQPFPHSSLRWLGGISAIVSYGVIDISYFAMKFVVVNDFYYFWMAPALLIVYLFVRHIYVTGSSS